MDIKNFLLAINQIAEEKGIAREKVLESIEAAIATAYKKDYGKKGQVIKAKLNPETGELKFWQIREVVTPEMLYTEEELAQLKKLPPTAEKKKEKIRFLPEKHILLEEAKKINPKIKAGEQLEIPLEVKQDYGRIAAQTAKQVILQKLREAEKESIFAEYKSKEGEIVSGLVQRVESRNVYLDIGKTLGVLPKEEQVPGEFYRPGQRLKVYILKVEETPRGPIVVLSRAYPKLVSKLFELEVPEIAAGQVVIKAIAREPGSRSKIAVASTAEGIDPVGSLVGQKGTRVMAVINELGGEKIDIIEYAEEPQKYVANALAPAKPSEVKIMPKNKVQVIVPNDQLSLAIGKNGQNVRLAAKLTGWKIDIKTEEGVTVAETAPTDTSLEATGEVVEAEEKEKATAAVGEKKTTKKKTIKSKK